jgi:hypothetical protein
MSWSKSDSRCGCIKSYGNLPRESALMRGGNLAPHFLLSWQKEMRRQRWKRKPLWTHPAKKITCLFGQVIFFAGTSCPGNARWGAVVIQLFSRVLRKILPIRGSSLKGL